MASCITSLLKPYGITFPIITSWRTFKEGDSEIQHQHLATELPKLISAYGYRYHILDSQNLNNAIAQINDCNQSHAICVLKKDSFDKLERQIEAVVTRIMSTLNIATRADIDAMDKKLKSMNRKVNELNRKVKTLTA